MFGSIVVGTDGSGTAKEAVRQAIDLAKQVGASLDIVSAYEPVAGDRLRQEQREAPKDVEWAVNPREDVDHTLEEAARETREAGVEVETFARQGDPADHTPPRTPAGGRGGRLAAAGGDARRLPRQ